MPSRAFVSGVLLGALLAVAPVSLAQSQTAGRDRSDPRLQPLVMTQIDSGDEPDAVDQGPDGLDPIPLGVGQAEDRPGSPLAITQIDEGRCQHAYGATAVEIAVPQPPPVESNGQNFHGAEQPAEDDFLVQAAISTLSQVVETALPDVVPRQLTGFEVALSSKPKRWFMLKSESPLLVLGRVVPMVTQEAVHTAWRDVARLSDDPGHLRCLFLMGGGLDSAENLGDVVSAERHRPARAGVGILVIPVDLTTWQSLVPSEAPDAVKAIIAGLPVTL